MDETTDTVDAVLLRLATVRELFNDHARKLQREGHYASVASAIDIRSYEGTVTIEVFVDAESGDSDQGICWWLEVKRFPPCWHVEGSLLAQTSAGQRVLQEIVAPIASTNDELLTNLGEVADRLLRTLPDQPS